MIRQMCRRCGGNLRWDAEMHDYQCRQCGRFMAAAPTPTKITVGRHAGNAGPRAPKLPPLVVRRGDGAKGANWRKR